MIWAQDALTTRTCYVSRHDDVVAMLLHSSAAQHAVRVPFLSLRARGIGCGSDVHGATGPTRGEGVQSQSRSDVDGEMVELHQRSR